MTDFDFASGDMQRCPNTEQKRRTLPKVPSFSDKRLFKEDDSLQTFSWPHGTRELIVERKRVHDILALNAKVKQPTDRQGYLGMDIPFEEAFIDSHDLRVELTDRLHTHYNANWKADIVSMHKCQPQNLFGAYHHAQGIVHATRDNLLEMQALYEDLRPETHALIKCCTSPMQLDKSMLAMQKPAQEIPNDLTPLHLQGDLLFKPACGFIFQDRDPSPPAHLRLRDKVKVTLGDRISAIDVQMARLQQEKDVLVNKQQDMDLADEHLERTYQCSRERERGRGASIH